MQYIPFPLIITKIMLFFGQKLYLLILLQPPPQLPLHLFKVNDLGGHIEKLIWLNHCFSLVFQCPLEKHLHTDIKALPKV